MKMPGVFIEEIEHKLPKPLPRPLPKPLPSGWMSYKIIEDPKTRLSWITFEPLERKCPKYFKDEE